MDLLYYFRTAPSSHLEFKGEGAICYAFRLYLTEKEIQGKCHAVWMHIQNESNQSTKKNHKFWNFQRNIGKFGGVADYLFLGDQFNLALEIKDGKKNKLSAAQLFFKKWCLREGVPYREAYGLEEAINIVHEYGIVD